MKEASSDATGTLTGGATLRDYIRLMRPSHYLKNAFVFASLVFAKALTDMHSVRLATMTAIAFCLISSAVYIVNDIADRRADAEHPKKRFRPIASGRVSVPAAIVQLLLLVALCAVVALQLPWQAGKVVQASTA